MFEVIKGDPKLVERCDVAAKLAQLRTGSDPIYPAATAEGEARTWTDVIGAAHVVFRAMLRSSPLDWRGMDRSRLPGRGRARRTVIGPGSSLIVPRARHQTDDNTLIFMTHSAI